MIKYLTVILILSSNLVFAQITRTVGSSGADFTSISDAMTVSGTGDIIQVIDAVHTEQDIQINKDITIEGLGMTNTIIQASDSYKTATNRVFSVAIGFTATIRNCTIRYGYLVGGSAGSGPSKGGGIFNGHILTLSNVKLIDNWVEGNSSNPSAYGGGIYNNNILTVENCVISGNTAKTYALIYQSGYGGGLASNGGTSTTITNSTISSNNALGADAANIYASGGGIYISQTNSAVLSMSGCTVSGNQANSRLAMGGGLSFVNAASNMFISNCTFSGNLATGGASGSGLGGGIYAGVYSTVISFFFQNCTIADNTATTAGGGVWSEYPSTRALRYRNCLIADNTSPVGPDIKGQIFSFGYNLIESTDGWSTDYVGGITSAGNIYNTDPQLSALAENNSLYNTYTHHIASTSPARDAGTSSGAPATDQRGADRNGTVDIGAYEYWGDDAPLPVELISFTAQTEGQTVIVNWRTETEENNYGFEILKRNNNYDLKILHMENPEQWASLGFVPGSGYSNSPKSYSFSDLNPGGGILYYCLKQIDTDGQFEFSDVISIYKNSESVLTSDFILEQNYPNPFNPFTTIKIVLPADCQVELTVHSVTGEKVADLANGFFAAGHHIFELNASSLTSGVYFYLLSAKSFGESYSQTKKLVILR